MTGIPLAPRKIKRRTLDPMLSRFGIEIRRCSSELNHFMISEKMRKKAIDLATTAIGVFLDRAGHSVAANELEAAVGGFYALAPSCPVRQTSGGCGFNASLELFVTARLLKPSVIVESGVYRGLTTWVLRQAAPDAKIISFDIDLSRLQRTEVGVEYIEADLSTYDFRLVSKKNALCFFDDHVSQALRIE